MGVLFPTSSTIRPVSPVLQGLLLGFFNEDESYIADKVFPTLNGVEKTGTLTNVAKASGFGDVTDSLLRGYKSKYHRNLGPQLGSATWNCEEYGDESLVDLQMLADANVGMDLEFVESQVALENVRVWKERRAADLLFNTTTFTQNVTLAGADKWSTSTADPMDDFDTGVQTIHTAIGKRPNTAIFGYQAIHTALKSPALLSYRPTTDDRNMLTLEQIQGMLKTFFRIDNVFVGDAFYNTANQGQTASLSPIWGDMVWIGYMDYSRPAAQLGANKAAFRASAAMRFVQQDLTSEEYEDPSVRSKVIRHREIQDELVTNASSAYIINDVT